MARKIKLNELDSVLSELSYPVEREVAVDSFGDVTLRLADGEVGLASVVAESSEDAFESADDLGNEVMSRLPREAVGEPYQSEGEG